MQPDQCPRYQNCNAPVCPLDEVPTVHLPGEPVCYYLRAAVKAGADKRFGNDPAFGACKACLPKLVEKYPPIRRALDRAAQAGFKTGNIASRMAEKRDSGVIATVV